MRQSAVPMALLLSSWPPAYAFSINLLPPNQGFTKQVISAKHCINSIGLSSFTAFFVLPAT
jgi:hypothetical protein